MLVEARTKRPIHKDFTELSKKRKKERLTHIEHVMVQSCFPAPDLSRKTQKDLSIEIVAVANALKDKHSFLINIENVLEDVDVYLKEKDFLEEEDEELATSNSMSAAGGGGGGRGNNNDNNKNKVGPMTKEDKEIDDDFKIKNEKDEILFAITNKMKFFRVAYGKEHKRAAIDLLNVFLDGKKEVEQRKSKEPLGVRVIEKLLDEALEETIKQLKVINYTLYGRVTKNQLSAWHKKYKIVRTKTENVYGRVNKQFERAIWDKLLIVEKESDGTITIVANIVCTLDQVIAAGKLVREENASFKEDSKIQAMVFSKSWACDVVARNNLSRRRISGDGGKDLPADAAIEKDLNKENGGRAYIIANALKLSQIWNFDETALTWAIAPLYWYVAKKSRGARARSRKGESNKNRATLFVSVNGIGHFAPMFLVIKHALSAVCLPGQDSHIVLNTLFNDHLRDASNEWEMRVWKKEGELKVPNQVKPYVNLCCKYLFNTRTGAVITSQHKAYNDTVRQLMYNELILKPMRDKYGDMMLWQDGCAIHDVDAVKTDFGEKNIKTAIFLPNLTPYMQPLDLIVNKVIKEKIRKNRVDSITADFKEFQKKYKAETDPNERKKMKFKPKPPQLHVIIKDIMKLYATDLKDRTLQKSIQKCFSKVGLAHANDGDGVDSQYTDGSSSFHNIQIGKLSGDNMQANALPVYMDDDIIGNGSGDFDAGKKL